MLTVIEKLKNYLNYHFNKVKNTLWDYYPKDFPINYTVLMNFQVFKIINTTSSH